MVYLDNAATTWPKPEAVYKAMDNCMRTLSGSPGRGRHHHAMAASQTLYEAREALAELLGARDPTAIAFSLNATAAINTAIFGLIKPRMHIITSSMEHNAVARPLHRLQRLGHRITVIACDDKGKIQLEELQSVTAQGADAIVLSHASNVTGTVQPLQEIGMIAKDHGCMLVLDAAQTAGVQEIDVNEMSIDVLAFSGHKGLLGPQGTGGLYVKPGVHVRPLLFGGTGSRSESIEQPEFMPDALESGTMNTPGIAGLLAGIQYVNKVGIQNICNKEQALTKMLHQGITGIPNVKVYGSEKYEKRVAVVSFCIADRDSGMIANRLDQEFSIACRGGLHCAPWAHKSIGSLDTGLVRFSPGYFNTPDEMQQAIEAVRKIAAEESNR